MTLSLSDSLSEVETQRYLSKYNHGFLWLSDHYGLVIFKHFNAAMLHIIFNLGKKKRSDFFEYWMDVMVEFKRVTEYLYALNNDMESLYVFAYLELCIQAEQTGVVLDQPRLFGFVQETHQQEQLLQSKARQRLLVA